MLALTRKVGQKIRIGPDIVIEVAEIYAFNDRVKLAIEAPRHLTILREELNEDAKLALKRRARR